MTKRELIDKAKEAMQHAYVPYSGFSVGAALLGKSGKVYTGCNVENSSFGATNCAERTAIFKAVSEGEREFDALAIVSSAGDTTYPCGICRQVMSEFMVDAELYFEDKEGNVKVYTVTDMLPHMFDNEIPSKKQ